MSMRYFSTGGAGASVGRSRGEIGLDWIGSYSAPPESVAQEAPRHEWSMPLGYPTSGHLHRLWGGPHQPPKSPFKNRSRNSPVSYHLPPIFRFSPFILPRLFKL